MATRKRKFWEHVEETTTTNGGGDRKFLCKFCKQAFSQKTPITRFKKHWSGIGGGGTKICDRVPLNVQNEVLADLKSTTASSSNDGADITIHRSSNDWADNTIPGSSNDGADITVPRSNNGGADVTIPRSNNAGTDNIIATSLENQGHQLENVMRYAEMGKDSHFPSPATQEFTLVNEENAHSPFPGGLMAGATDDFACWVQRDFEINTHNTTMGLLPPVVGGSFPERLRVNQAELGGDAFQPINPVCLPSGSNYGQPCSSSMNNDVIIINPMGDSTLEGPQHCGDESRGDAFQPTNPVCLPIESNYGQPCSSSMNNNVININPVRHSTLEGPQNYVYESRGDAFPTTKLVGGEFEKNKKTIWSWLVDDEATSSMGIYGMGGVGKTTLLTHIYNQLLENPDTFPHVYWITVSQEFSIYKLQNDIAKAYLDLSSEDDERKRAAKLSKALRTRQKWVLILDDLWTNFEFDKVGIPIQIRGCKLILTTRSERVCQQMFCKEMIKVDPLPSEEAWTLFMEKLGPDVVLPPRVEEIAEFLTRECDGLPLGIITMAGTMRGVDDIQEWRSVLEELRKSKVRNEDMEPKVFRILRFSYTRLNDSELKQCFLSCSLFPEDFEISRNDLIDYLIDEGVITGLMSRQAEFDKGNAMLNKLESVCLLERGRKSVKGYIKMHDLIRDMAIQIQDSQAMVQAGEQLKELPNVVGWTVNLVRVSLMHNQIEEIPSSRSSLCPKLLSLSLCHNKLRSIADSFFKEFSGLKVLNLSHTCIKNLPDSVSALVNLVALLLESCKKLRHLPSLKNLRALRRLDLGGTALEKVPQDIEWLSDLRYLRLNGCGGKKFPTGILPKLSHLQVLIIEELVDGKYAPVTVKGNELACLKYLETLECHFERHSDLLEFVKSRDEKPSLVPHYKFAIG